MGFVHNILIYLTLEEMAKQSYGLRYAGGSSRRYFPDLVLRPVPKLPTVTVVYQLLQITSGGSVIHFHEIIFQQLRLMHRISETPQPHRDHIALTNCKTNANGHSLIPERNVLNLNLSFLKSLHAGIDDYTSAKAQVYKCILFIFCFAPILLIFTLYDALTTCKCRIGTKFDCRNEDARIP